MLGWVYKSNGKNTQTNTKFKPKDKIIEVLSVDHNERNSDYLVESFLTKSEVSNSHSILLHDKAKALDVTFELYLAEGHGHGVMRTVARYFAWLNYATDFFERIGIIDKQPASEVLSGNLKKYNGESVAKIATVPDSDTTRLRRQRSAVTESPLAPSLTPANSLIPMDDKLADSNASGLQPILGKKGSLLLRETFDGNELSKGWTGKTGGLQVADGTLHASQNRSDGRLGLFNREQPMQDAVIEIDFQFSGARGINVSCNPSPGELRKHGHLFSVMITPRMWNITEHNDKSDPNSRSKALATASAKFESRQWYTLLLEFKGDDVIARVEGKETLRASSKDFGVKKPGIEFRVSGGDGEEVLFDNLKVWELR